MCCLVFYICYIAFRAYINSYCYKYLIALEWLKQVSGGNEELVIVLLGPWMCIFFLSFFLYSIPQTWITVKNHLYPILIFDSPPLKGTQRKALFF